MANKSKEYSDVEEYKELIKTTMDQARFSLSEEDFESLVFFIDERYIKPFDTGSDDDDDYDNDMDDIDDPEDW